MFAAAALYVRNIFSSWTTHLTLYAVAATMGLIGLLYFVSSGHAVLARMYSPEAAGLMIGGVFAVLALIMLAFVKMRASRTSPATKGIASLALASTAGRLALRNSGTVGHVASHLAKPALATAGAGLLLLGRLLGKPSVEQRGRDLAEEPLSLRSPLELLLRRRSGPHGTPPRKLARSGKNWSLNCGLAPLQCKRNFPTFGPSSPLLATFWRLPSADFGLGASVSQALSVWCSRFRTGRL